MNLTDVSKSAIATLRSRVVEAHKSPPLILDPMAEHCLGKLVQQMTAADRALFLERKFSSTLTRYIALRARKYDKIAKDFLLSRPTGRVLSLGCGFDTRYWRIGKPIGRYLELDLPEVVEIKRRILGTDLEYDLIGSSVLETWWVDEVAAEGNKDFLIIAEGLLMYLDRADVIRLFSTFSENFHHSLIAAEVVTEKYTRGIWKRIAAGKMKRQLGFDSGSSYNFGVRDAHEIESFADGIAIVEEWSFVEDPDMRPRIYRHLGMSRTQWTVVATIE